MLRPSLRFLVILAALSLLPGMQAFPADVTPDYSAPAIPETPRVASHGMGARPSSLLGRHYTVGDKRDVLLVPTAMVSKLGLPGKSSEPTNPRTNPNTNTNAKTSKKTTTKDTSRTPQPVARDLFSYPALERDDEVAKRDTGDVNYVSNVGPTAPPPSDAPAPAPPRPSPPSPPPARQAQYKDYPPSASAVPTAASKDPKKGQSKSKGKDKSKDSGKEGKKKS